MFSIVIPHWNNIQILKKCLESIFQSTSHTVRDKSYTSDGVPKGLLRGVIPFEIIVVDNGSTDASRKYFEQLSAKSYQLKAIFNDRNLGFAKAVNQGIEAAENDWVAVMNNDVRVDKEWFEEIYRNIQMFEYSNLQKIGCIFGKVLNWEGTEIESAGLDFNLSGKSRNIGNGEKRIEKYSNKKIIWGAPASIVVYRKQALEEVGGFDEDFFAYLEDVDLAIRLADRGWKTVYLPKAVSCHYGGKTGDQICGFRQRYTGRNWWYIIIKHYPIKVFLVNLPKIVIEQSKNLLAVKGIKDKIWLVKEKKQRLQKKCKRRCLNLL